MITRWGTIMEEVISATEAKRKFSLMLRRVREGHSFVVTSHGQPIARFLPTVKHEGVASGARAALLSRLQSQLLVNVGHWSREEFYD